MTGFDASQHPRAVAGTFAVKVQTAPETSLRKPAFTAGERVLAVDRLGTVDLVVGDTLTVRHPNGDLALYSTRQVSALDETDEVSLRRTEIAAAISEIRDFLPTLPDQVAEDLSWTERSINNGAWGDLRNEAQVALIDAKIFGKTDPWLDDVTDTIDDISAESRSILSNERHVARAIASQTAQALASRHLIGEVDGWSQDGYDHLTRAWRECVGSVHPDDETSPASWAKRPAVTATGRRQFFADLQRINDVIDERDALVFDDDESRVGVDEEKLGPELSSAYTKLQQYGYANGLVD